MLVSILKKSKLDIHICATYEERDSLVNQTVFRERACASERGRGRRENTFTLPLNVLRDAYARAKGGEDVFLPSPFRSRMLVHAICV